MGVTINPLAIDGAVPYNQPQNGQPFFACKIPDNGARYTSFQLNFVAATKYLVSLKQGNPNPPLEQIAALYVDNSFGTYDLHVIVPTSGQQVVIPAMTTKLFPVISNERIPDFYVIAGNAAFPTSDQISSYSSVVSEGYNNVVIMALSQFIPEFDSGRPKNDIITNRYFGTFTAGVTPAVNINLTGAGRALIKGLKIDIFPVAAALAPYRLGLTSNSNTNFALFHFYFMADVNRAKVEICDYQQLNYTASAGLSLNTLGSVAGLTDFLYTVNINGIIVAPA